MIVDNLSAFQAVRKVFIESVALGKIQQGLRSRARTAANLKDSSRDVIYFKPNDRNCWNSSAAKIDKEGH